MDDISKRVEAALAQALAGCDVETSSDEWGTYITHDFALQIAEFIAGDLIEALKL